MKPVLNAFARLAAEPPFPAGVYGAAGHLLPVSVRFRARWDVAPRPHYLVSTLFAADQAKLENLSAISVVEFGVGGGAGLLQLQRAAAAVTRETGVSIRVFGFDSGAGLPEFNGDYRDFPDVWQKGWYGMDEMKVRAMLDPRTTLVIGDVRDTVPRFLTEHNPPPIGFVAVDLDLYSSTAGALQLLSSPDRRMLKHVPVYLDDIHMDRTHRFGGELLAVDEFNEQNDDVKIDSWRALPIHRPFRDAGWLSQMWMAHDLAAIGRIEPSREQIQL